ncbi:MAG: O-antigen ligase family protein [Oscillospiraceae bacterium]|jgi:hypothetical protein
MQKRFDAKTADLRVQTTELYIYVMLLVFPLFTGLHGYEKITASKFVFFETATLLWLGSLLLFSLCWLREPNRLPKARSTGAEALVLLYLALCVLSALLSPYGSKTILGSGRRDGLYTTALCCAAFWGVSHFGRPKAAYVYAAALGGVLNCLVALLQLLGFDPLWLFPSGYTFFDAGVRFSSVFLGTIGNADLFAAYLCLLLPLTLFYYITAAKRELPLLPALSLLALCLFACGVSGGVLAFAACFVCAVPFVVTNSERLRRLLDTAAVLCISAFFAFPLQVTTPEGGGAVALRGYFPGKAFWLPAAAGLLLVFRFMTEKKEFRSRNLRIVLPILSLACVTGSFAAVYFYPGSSGTLYELSCALHGHLEDRYGSSRILIWRKLLALFPEYPLFGGGPGTLAERLDLRFSRVVPETGKTLSAFVDNAHNEYLGMLVNTGILSLAAYLAAQAATLRAAVHAKADRFAAPLACALLCYWMQSFFGLGLFLVAPMMWILWGLAARCQKSE